MFLDFKITNFCCVILKSRILRVSLSRNRRACFSVSWCNYTQSELLQMMRDRWFFFSFNYLIFLHSFPASILDQIIPSFNPSILDQNQLLISLIFTSLPQVFWRNQASGSCELNFRAKDPEPEAKAYKETFKKRQWRFIGTKRYKRGQDPEPRGYSQGIS